MGVWGLVATKPGGLDIDLGKMTLVCPCHPAVCPYHVRMFQASGPLEMSHPDPGPTPHLKSWTPMSIAQCPL